VARASTKAFLSRGLVSKNDGIPTLSAAELAEEASAMDAEMEALFGAAASDDISSLPGSNRASGSHQSEWAHTAEYGKGFEQFEKSNPHASPTAPGGAATRPSSGEHSTHDSAASSAQSAAGRAPPQVEAAVEQFAQHAPQPIINITYNIHHHHYYAGEGGGGRR